jgi:hypothetical protein
MGIDPAGDDKLSPGVEGFLGMNFEPGADRFNLFPLDEYIREVIVGCGHNPAIGNERRHKCVVATGSIEHR